MEEKMVINILGSGTCVPRLDRYPCAILIRFKTRVVLVDAGPGIMGQLLKLGVEPDDIDAIFLSHFHLDHCADLAPLLFAAKYPEFTRTKKLTLAGGPGLNAWYKGVNHTFGQTLDMPEKYFECIEVSGRGQFALHGIEVTHMPMAHKPESTGYRFTDPSGFSLVYSGDTDVTQNLIRLAENAHILICESAMPDGMKVPGHLTPSLAGEMAQSAGVKLLVLTHLYPACDTVDIAAQARTTFKGNVRVAQDLMTLPS